MNRDRALGWLAIGAGIVLALAVQVREPVGVPLYDAVPITEPYRFLSPGSGQAGNPTSFESTPAVNGSVSPVFAAATTDSPPQAQLIALQDAFELTPGATALRVTITPVPPEVLPTQGSIAGNVYRFAVTDQAGTALVAKPCSGCRSMVLRAPEGTGDATVQRLTDGAWTTVSTFHAGAIGMYQANVDALGDFALVTTSAAGGFDPIIVAVLALVLLLVAVGGLFWYRRRPPTMPVAQLRPTGRVPSKRRGSGRSPRGRSNQ